MTTSGWLPRGISRTISSLPTKFPCSVQKNVVVLGCRIGFARPVTLQLTILTKGSIQ